MEGQRNPSEFVCVLIVRVPLLVPKSCCVNPEIMIKGAEATGKRWQGLVRHGRDHFGQ